MSIESLVSVENKQSGRVIPKWRYWSGYCLLGVAGVWGAGCTAHGFPFWLAVVGSTVIFAVYVALFQKFKARSIS